MSQIGSQLKIMRIRKGMTQKEVAEGAEISQAHVSRVEKMQVSPSIKTLEKMAKAMKTTITEITNIELPSKKSF